VVLASRPSPSIRTDNKHWRNMNKLKGTVVLVGLLATGGIARAQDFKQRYVGKSSCATDIQSDLSDFGLRLDKTQRTYLIQRRFSDAKIAIIVQYKDENDKCGVIRDVVQVRRASKYFEFSCVDPQAPGDVLIGTSIRNGNVQPVTAIEAWRVDLKEQKFVEVRHKVRCAIENYAGEDDGSDLVDEAKKRAAQQKPGQTAPEFRH
jgi:hypothetical protein